MWQQLCLGAQTNCNACMLQVLEEKMAAHGLRPNDQIVRAVIHNLGTRQQADRARSVFDGMRSEVKYSRATYSALINAYAESHRPHDAVLVLREMQVSADEELKARSCLLPPS
jgi:pentatricopeptide repeat protein